MKPPNMGCLALGRYRLTDSTSRYIRHWFLLAQMLSSVGFIYGWVEGTWYILALLDVVVSS